MRLFEAVYTMLSRQEVDIHMIQKMAEKKEGIMDMILGFYLCNCKVAHVKQTQHPTQNCVCWNSRNNYKSDPL